jgi:phosphogluconate dehydratase
VAGGAIGRVQDGDIIRLDARAGTLSVAADLSSRPAFDPANHAPQRGFARPLFSAMRAASGSAEQGAGLTFTEI